MLPDEPLPHVALEVVAASCHVARTVQSELDDIRRLTKDDRSPVTVADYAVQAIVSIALHEADPQVRIVGEERADLLRDDEHAVVRDAVVRAVRTVRPEASVDRVLDAIDHCGHDGTAEAFWALDPVDGTKGFLRGQQYAIALGRIDDGRVTLGVMGCPNLPCDHDAPLDTADPEGVLFVAAEGRGAWELPAADPGAAHRIRARRIEGGQLDGLRVCASVEKAHSSRGDTHRILSELGTPGEPVRLDSQCKYAVVARGQADAYLRLPTRRDYVERIWDHAAGMIIATEAGAVVSDVTGAPLDFSRGRRLEGNRGIVCAASGVHEHLVRVIAELGIAAPA